MSVAGWEGRVFPGNSGYVKFCCGLLRLAVAALWLLLVLSWYATISHVPHSESMFMVAVSSRFIKVLPGVLRFTCSSAMVEHGAWVGRSSIKHRPLQRSFIQVSACVCACVCVFSCTIITHMYWSIFIFWLGTITLWCFIVHTCKSRGHRLSFPDKIVLISLNFSILADSVDVI